MYQRKSDLLTLAFRFSHNPISRDYGYFISLYVPSTLHCSPTALLSDSRHFLRVPAATATTLTWPFLSGVPSYSTSAGPSPMPLASQSHSGRHFLVPSLRRGFVFPTLLVIRDYDHCLTIASVFLPARWTPLKHGRLAILVFLWVSFLPPFLVPFMNTQEVKEMVC